MSWCIYILCVCPAYLVYCNAPWSVYGSQRLYRYRDFYSNVHCMLWLARQPRSTRDSVEFGIYLQHSTTHEDLFLCYAAAALLGSISTFSWSWTWSWGPGSLSMQLVLAVYMLVLSLLHCYFREKDENCFNTDFRLEDSEWDMELQELADYREANSLFRDFAADLVFMGIHFAIVFVLARIY